MSEREECVAALCALSENRVVILGDQEQQETVLYLYKEEDRGYFYLPQQLFAISNSVAFARKGKNVPHIL